MNRTRRNILYLTYVATGLIACAYVAPTAQAATTLDWQVTAYADGNHNAFTDLIRWNGSYYLCFRHGGSHMSMDGEIRVMKSADLKTWKPCGVLDTFGDDRDPHFVAGDDRLFVYFGTWDLEHESGHGLPNRGTVKSYFATTQDGENWSKVQGVYEAPFWLWRVRRHDGFFYSPAYTALRPTPPFRETRLLRSTDGLNWTAVGTVTIDRMSGEADVFWLPGGEVWLISRTGDKAGDAEWFHSDAQMTKWTGKATGVLIHSPAIASWNNRVFVAGRGRDQSGYVTKLWEIAGGKFVDLLTLPSGGDTGYPGLIADPKSLDAAVPSFFISWYSQHEIRGTSPASKAAANIYVGRVTVTP